MFASNAIMLWIYNKTVYAWLMIILVATSVWNHMAETKISEIIDKIAVYAVIVYGGYKFITETTNNKNIILACFLMCGILYHMVLPNITNPLTYVYLHGILHIVASIGHHLIAMS